MNPSPEWRIEFFTNEHGKSPVLEFIKSLTDEERAKIRNQLRLLKEFGVSLGLPQAKPLTGHKPLWELRPMPTRLIYAAFTGKRFVILHGFKKTTQKTLKKEIRVAQKRYQALIERERWK